MPTTIRDHHESVRVRVTGAPSLTDGRSERMMAVVFDGRRLGDYPIPTVFDKEHAKRLDEMQALAYALVGCNADLELTEIDSLAPVGGKATPDFEATTVNAQKIRIELARLTDGEEKRYLNAFGEIVQRAANTLSKEAKLDAATGGGRIYLRFYGGVPTPRDIVDASTELAQYVMLEVPLKPVSITLWPVPTQYPSLNRLGAHVAHLDHDGPTTLVPDASPSRANMKNALASFVPLTGQKKAKVADYADGKPVWLVMYCDTKLFYPLGVVQALAEVDDFSPRPFDRVLVGCFTAGVTFIEPNRRPIYTDLSS